MVFMATGWFFMVSDGVFMFFFSRFQVVFHGSRLVFMVFHGFRLYPGPTIQSRSAARRVAQDLVQQKKIKKSTFCTKQFFEPYLWGGFQRFPIYVPTNYPYLLFLAIPDFLYAPFHQLVLCKRETFTKQPQALQLMQKQRRQEEVNDVQEFQFFCLQTNLHFDISNSLQA